MDETEVETTPVWLVEIPILGLIRAKSKDEAIRAFQNHVDKTVGWDCAYLEGEPWAEWADDQEVEPDLPLKPEMAKPFWVNP